MLKKGASFVPSDGSNLMVLPRTVFYAPVDGTKSSLVNPLAHFAPPAHTKSRVASPCVWAPNVLEADSARLMPWLPQQHGARCVPQDGTPRAWAKALVHHAMRASTTRYGDNKAQPVVLPALWEDSSPPWEQASAHSAFRARTTTGRPSPNAKVVRGGGSAPRLARTIWTKHVQMNVRWVLLATLLSRDRRRQLVPAQTYAPKEHLGLPPERHQNIQVAVTAHLDLLLCPTERVAAGSV